ncbi:D-alanyl-D-alanine carboxypeptidase family protein [Nodularia spumigena CS-584]|uniref:D-alanyl-D-alanine carboxypeptidase n=3 Tax=Nodularia spumigena TaxID=70799 RepID=A0A2S0Q6Y7_NODSP|nr:D-alanyl-D-alanine carboxypeptidase family protein [Nodularia spumigena]AHJ29528.1 D-alanyl-D-alanine carboxypeptidase [Nodularia spumigena CCY9414]AVZ30183.1 D-alanyl-D-alanine carboxypeptidase [Nodularia spumigena UHCC 0039]EAW42978.1 Peptidase M15B and M15C, D,D-carboxypeptidase VanY/endolysin [Nodularia spumigena CCY9414]KZL47971.1 D-alanyl-D-alanine carboxypeptidase [Nodularia spumigena CENA596]MDB9383702.1 D-alanyl-D-alanine carboxypeptidase family protein [Nodularia spumigena CS-584]
MNKARFSGQPHNLSGDSSEDIPVALRDSPEAAPKRLSSSLILLITGVSGLIVLGLIASFWFFVITPRNTVAPQPASNGTATTDTQSGNSVNSQDNNLDALLGHLTYPEAPESELLPITADGRIRLRKAAAEKYQAMEQAARREGVILAAISGFRSVKQQEQLFFGVGARRNQTPAERATVSAPPGHSEHHTGYAVDIGDGAVPATNLQTNFENTKAFRWLEGNAARFGFEISFPENNSQGVSYEPWHWRFVGDRHSLELFYKARNLNPTQP